MKQDILEITVHQNGNAGSELPAMSLHLTCEGGVLVPGSDIQRPIDLVRLEDAVRDMASHFLHQVDSVEIRTT